MAEAEIITASRGAFTRVEPLPLRPLAKLYVEPTNGCNLECRTCIRHAWDEPIGQMSAQTFARILDGLGDFTPPPTLFFGGFGEPLAHPDIVTMTAQAKALGARVELITNGMLLTPALSHQLIASGLDALWVSLDGATPESYADVRLGATLPNVLDNLAQFRAASRSLPFARPEIGIAFVAMKRNVADLPEIVRLGRRLDVSRFLVTNVLPYTAEMCAEVLYGRLVNDDFHGPSPWAPQIQLPKIDWDETTREPLYRLLRGHQNQTLVGGADLGRAHNRCPFIERGAAAVGWDGRLSPCLPLLYSHPSFVNERERFSRRHAFGSVAEHSLRDLWQAPDYAAFRQRVEAFDFSPCLFCGGCSYSESNEEDCFGSPAPTCGGCLWAQGVIQCP